MLEHVLRDSGARRAVIEAPLLPQLRQASAAVRVDIAPIMRTASGDPAAAGLEGSALLSNLGACNGELAIRKDGWDVMALMYTSGTTGLSKGVPTTEAHAYGYASPAALGMAAPDDVVLVALPLNHVAGLFSGVYNALIAGATAHVLPRFSVTSFWDDVARTGATCALLVDAMVKLLLRADDSEPASASALRRVSLSPISDASNAFMERFGITDCCSGYGSTEAGAVFAVPLGASSVHNTIGWPRPDYEVAVVDEHDVPVPPGQIGELLVRPREPWIMMNGYWGRPEESAAAWRNLWFHTGDLAQRRPVDGQYVFHGRMRDAIRRRGENISAATIEQEALAFPGVVEAVAVPVADELSGHEVLLVVQCEHSGEVSDPMPLLEHLREHLPAFMVPRYLRFVEGFERSVSGKVRRDLTRDHGLATGTFDRQSAAPHS